VEHHVAVLAAHVERIVAALAGVFSALDLHRKADVHGLVWSQQDVEELLACRDRDTHTHTHA
jgi:hypothetical protein